MLLILGFSVLGIVLYRRRTVRPEIDPRQANRQILGFDNPVYNHQPDQVEGEVHYQDVDPPQLSTFDGGNVPDGNNEYLDIQA